MPIPLLLAGFNTVKSNAFSSKLFFYNTSTKQESDVTGRTQSLYDAKTFINFGAGVNAGIYASLLFFKVLILSYKLGVAVEAYALPAAGSTNKITRF